LYPDLYIYIFLFKQFFKCWLHENLIMKLKPFSNYGQEFWDSMLCDSTALDGSCWMGNYTDCQNGAKFQDSHGDDDKSKEVYWKQWMKDDSGRLKIETRHGCMGELIEDIFKDLTHFQEHMYV